METETRPPGPHSQKTQEDHSETGRGGLSGLNSGCPLPQVRRGSRMASSSGEVVRVPVRAANAAIAKMHMHIGTISSPAEGLFWHLSDARANPPSPGPSPVVGRKPG